MYLCNLDIVWRGHIYLVKEKGKSCDSCIWSYSMKSTTRSCNLCLFIYSWHKSPYSLALYKRHVIQTGLLCCRSPVCCCNPHGPAASVLVMVCHVFGSCFKWIVNVKTHKHLYCLGLSYGKQWAFHKPNCSPSVESSHTHTHTLMTISIPSLAKPHIYTHRVMSPHCINR